MDGLKMTIRKIKAIVLHASDSDIEAHDNIEVIRQWHIARGFADVGYHFFVTRKGLVMSGRPEHQVGAHVEGHNAYTLGICFSGRTFKNFDSPQFEAGRRLVEKLLKKYHLTWNDVKLHREFNKGKSCPNFTLDQFRKVP
jgi:N-acetyl-anhydromuramyl-L-alanine amidase AmpD